MNSAEIMGILLAATGLIGLAFVFPFLLLVYLIVIGVFLVAKS